MGRLLDMEEIIRLAKTTYPTDDVKKITWLLCHTPTAYNVEKVVEELECYEKHLCPFCSEEAIKIVRMGGVE